MSELIKIKDVSLKYALTARTLRYYEDIGLLTSTRTEGYAHRMYDETAIKQIIILCKLNISVKDIKRIFDAPDSEVVLDVLGKKAENIDDEVALLHELKGIVLDFITQIKQSDFHNDADVKLLYDKAKEIESQIANEEQNKSNVKLDRMVAIYFDDAPSGGYTGEYSFTNQGELVIVSNGHSESDYIGLQSKEFFRLPLQMDVYLKSSDEVWLHYNKGGLAINDDTNGSYYLHVNDIFTGQHKAYPMNRIPLNEYTKVSWALDYGEANVYINDEHFHTHEWIADMTFTEKVKVFAPVDITAGNANTVTVKSINVTENQITMPGITRLMKVSEKLSEGKLAPPIAVNTYRQTMNPTRFIGKKYASGGEAWGNWSDDWDWDEPHSLFSRLEVDATAIYKDKNPQDGCALIGLMCHPGGDHSCFEYWLGFFTPENTPVPEGYDYTDFPAQDVGICWLYGKEEDVMARETVAYEKLKAEGFELIGNWWFERYVPHRETADSTGYKIMDICFFAKSL